MSPLLSLTSIASVPMSPSALSKELSDLLTSNPYDGRSIQHARTVVRCSCRSQRKHGLVQCSSCNTHQHLSCYYPGRDVLSEPERLQHTCTSCRRLFIADQPANSKVAKRKADEDLGSTSPKRIKQSNSPQADLSADPKDPRPAGKPVPFPEKVAVVDRQHIAILCADEVLARCHRRTQWRDRVPCRQQRQRPREHHHPDRPQVHLSETAAQNAKGLHCAISVRQDSSVHGHCEEAAGSRWVSDAPANASCNLEIT